MAHNNNSQLIWKTGFLFPMSSGQPKQLLSSHFYSFQHCNWFLLWCLTPWFKQLSAALCFLLGDNLIIYRMYCTFGMADVSLFLHVFCLKALIPVYMQTRPCYITFKKYIFVVLVLCPLWGQTWIVSTVSLIMECGCQFVIYTHAARVNLRLSHQLTGV